MLQTFRSSSKLINTFTGHTDWICSIDYSTFDCRQLMCSGSSDKTACVWDVDSNKQIKSFKHLETVYCVRFSPYSYHCYRRSVICFLLYDKTIRFGDIKHNRQLQAFNGHQYGVHGIEFSPFNGDSIKCVNFSPLQNNNNNKDGNDESNSIDVIGGNGYIICSGSYDRTIRIWDIETTKQLIMFKGHEYTVTNVKYGSNELGINGDANTVLSGSDDKSVRLWNIRSGEQIQVFNGHTNTICCSNVIYSGSSNNTIRFWDIRSNKNELYMIKGCNEKDNGILCLNQTCPNTLTKSVLLLK
ncbi:hypothetical protein RFI_16510 [Reticulomyxa filosa]|uniref:Uncharacterized protein n=1 Tax=Reticulomyxa filosa TaxID=46433 RepID=X6N4M2_RETFI|nr:hypothetical protein RFI_16510 [Reticulomyxa filosa]|eukprot:ETO20709.1 hypothetical protein RFI_16510 [Reticulomyxa filosa]